MPPYATLRPIRDIFPEKTDAAMKRKTAQNTAIQEGVII